MSYTKIKTVEQACAKNGTTLTKILPFKGKRLTADQISINAYAMLVEVVRAINGKRFKPDWTNSDQAKYEPRFYELTENGFSHVSCHGWSSGTDVGSRLCFESYNKAKYAVTTFKNIYLQFLTGTIQK